ncbi:MAG: NADH-quinone oxidoreductase subunit M [Thioalkalispiraceae bacterium]|jgi:NADH-quinone oxidoreductase subunit M
MGILTVILLIPIIGAALVAVTPKRFVSSIRPIAILTAAICLIVSWSLLISFVNSSAELQFAEHIPWNPRLGTSYSVGIDGISLPLILLATLLCFIAILSSHKFEEQSKGYYSLMLLLESALLGVFVAQDWSLFYIFWELTLIPLFFLIDRWGGKRKHQAALNFVLYTMGGSVFMLVSLLLVFDSMPAHSFAMVDMLAAPEYIEHGTQILIFLGFMIGFGVKIPIVPLHGWLSLAHVEAPSPVSILLSGILLKMGAYGLIRAAMMLPGAIEALQEVLMGIALFGIVYGGLLAWRQSDLKSMIAYSSISHMGVVVLGIATLSVTGFIGTVAQMVAHGLVAGTLFLLIGLLYGLTGTRDVNDYSSLVRSMPRFAFFTVVAFIAVVGIPGTAGFISEFHIMIAGYDEWGLLVIVLSLGVMISAAYAIRTVVRLFSGPVREQMRDLPDLSRIDFIAVAILVFWIIILGVFPSLLLNIISTSAKNLSQVFK